MDLWTIDTTVNPKTQVQTYFKMDKRIPIPRNNVAVAGYGYMKNTGSLDAGNGHGIGILGEAEDDAGGLHFLIGTEGKVTGRSSGVNFYYAGVSYARFINSVNLSFLVGHMIQREITANGSTPLAQGNSYGLWIKDIVGGATNYGAYIEDQTGGSVDVGLALAGADNICLWVGSGADNVDAANGITFGASFDTDLYRGAANLLATSGYFYPLKGIYPRIGTTTDTGTLTINADLTDQYNVTALAQAMQIANMTGTPLDGQRIRVRIKSAASQNLTYGSTFRGSTDIALPATTTGSGKTDYLEFVYNAADTKWDLARKTFGA